MCQLIRKETPVSILICWYLAWPTCVTGVKNLTYAVADHFGSIGFPEGSGMGLFFALGVPVDVPNKSVLFSLYFEANYALPPQGNSTYEEVLYRKKRRIDRRLVYEILIHKLESFGFPGAPCLLRMICETSNHPFTYNGVFGDILQIVFTPSSSENENLPYEIIQAEYADNCGEKYVKCPKSPLELISRFVNSYNA